MSEKNFAVYEGAIVFRLIANKKENTYDIENGLMQRLNHEPLLSHDDAMMFIQKYSLDNGFKSVRYALTEK